MKKLSILAASAALAASLAAPVTAQEATNDPFVATQGAAIPALAIIGGMAVVLTIAAGSGTD